MTKAARQKNPDVIIFSHGGPIAMPEDTAYMYKNTESVGFLGASSIERIPIEDPLAEAVKKFKDIPLK